MCNHEPSRSSGSGFATIPGGDSLTAHSYAQTVVGYTNIENPSTSVFVQGTPHSYSGGALGMTQETPLFIVGNGDGVGSATPQSDAFEVTYDGHSIVHDQLGNAATVQRAPVFGGTYADNIVYAWGDVPPGGGVATADFGLDPTTAVINSAPGVYVVTLNSLPGSGFHTFTQASITVTVEDTSLDTSASIGCATATASRIGAPAPNQFIVRTYQNCIPTDEAFYFKVCGR